MSRGALALLLAPAIALAEKPAPVPASEPPVTPIEAGAPAPFDGVVMTEPRLVYFLGLAPWVAEVEGQVTARDRALKTIEEQLATEKQRQINGTWWGRNGFWFGVALGVAATGALVWAVK